MLALRSSLLRLRAPTASRLQSSTTATLKRLSTTVPSPTSFTNAAAAAAGETTSGGGSSILRFARERPYATNILIATVKTSLCDIIAQKYIEKKEQINWKRNAVFLAFGCFYLGGIQWFIYVDVFKKLWPNMATFANMTLREKLASPAGIKALIGQTAFDNFIHYPFIYFPVFYAFKEGIQGDHGEEASAAGIAAAGLRKYQGNCVEDNLKIWALWIPGDLFVYAVPIWMRLPLNHALSFVWTCYLSFLRGGSGGGGDEAKSEGGSSSKPSRGAGKLPWTPSGVDQREIFGGSDKIVLAKR